MGKPKYGKGVKSKGSQGSNKSGGAPIKGGKIKASHILVGKIKQGSRDIRGSSSRGEFSKSRSKIFRMLECKQGGQSRRISERKNGS